MRVDQINNEPLPEIWKDVKGCEGLYQVSNLGRVKSLPRKYRKNEYILKPYNHYGYLAVDFHGSNNVLVHRLVAEAFIKNPNGKSCVNHKDSNKSNNNAYNLEWVTQRENSQHHYAKNPKSSKHVGVGYRKDLGKWRARIQIKGKEVSLGNYKKETEALKAYQTKLKTL